LEGHYEGIWIHFVIQLGGDVRYEVIVDEAMISVEGNGEYPGRMDVFIVVMEFGGNKTIVRLFRRGPGA
jgi:hypothetical protein